MGSGRESLDEIVERRVVERTRELDSLMLALVAALERADPQNDPDTRLHMLRVAEYSKVVARRLGLGREFMDRLERAAWVHDVGKALVPEAILRKTGRLSTEEFDRMKAHTVHGYDILRKARSDEVSRNVALSHHERFDGTGYPLSLRGEAIPIEARIVALADTLYALTTRRAYRAASPPGVAERVIREEAGRQFDPAVVEAMVLSVDALREVRDRLHDP